MENNLLKCLLKNSIEIPDHPVIVENGRVISSKCLWELISTAATYYDNIISIGEYLVIMLPIGINWVIAVLGAMLAGIPTILLDCRTRDELKKYLNEVDVGCVLVDDGTPVFIETNTLVLNDSDFSHIIENVISHYDLDLDKINQQYKLVLFTSGTTDFPKGVIHSFSGITNACNNYLQTVKLTKNDIICAAIPLYHSYGFGSCFVAGLCSGAKLILNQQFQVGKIVRILQNDNVTVFYGVPIMFDLINRFLNGKSLTFENLRLCISAGVALPERIYNDFYSNTGIYISHELGSTETGTIAINLSSGSDSVYGLVGYPLNGVQVKIDPIDGELLVHSSGRPMGYIGSNEKFSEWQRTGDIANILEGKIQLVGRKSFFINVSGKKVNPHEVEQVIKDIEGIQDVFVFGENDELTNERICAYVVKSSPEITLKDIRIACVSKLAAYKVPKKIRFVSNLRKTELGKNKKLQE